MVVGWNVGFDWLSIPFRIPDKVVSKKIGLIKIDFQFLPDSSEEE